MTNRTLVIVNTTGRQGASLARVAAAVGYNVRAHITTKLSEKDGAVAKELRQLQNIELVQGSLEDGKLISRLFVGARLAFINTISWGDEVAIGKALADAAKKAGVQHYVYSSMPDHAVFGRGWPSLPLWSCKFTVENYIRQIGLPATFVYMGIYNNNFTSLPYPLFCMKLQPNGGFQWTAPFHPDKKLPWLDAEHDVGPAVVQILKDGIQKWSGYRIGLAYQLLTPKEVCAAFSRGLKRPCSYKRGPITIEVPIPSGYRSQLEGIQELFGKHEAPYFGPDIQAPADALKLWEGYRGMEEYAREAFPLEEAANGLTWMQ
ncbi:MAG: hypothetical protein L6R39_000767 [Caloplaca ligustica]|nr:MAG: hypothetical protein L6R39_000767 [Caloplaca ligustica]